VLLGAGPVVLVEVGTGRSADGSPASGFRQHAASRHGQDAVPRRRLGIGRGHSVPRPSPPNPHGPHVRRSGGVRRTPDRAGRVARATTRVVSHAWGVPRWSRGGRCELGGVQISAELEIMAKLTCFLAASGGDARWDPRVGHSTPSNAPRLNCSNR